MSEDCSCTEPTPCEHRTSNPVVHSDEFVVMFLGYLTGALPELHHVEAPRLMDAWADFKHKMGARAALSESDAQ